MQVWLHGVIEEIEEWDSECASSVQYIFAEGCSRWKFHGKADFDLWKSILFERSVEVFIIAQRQGGKGDRWRCAYRPMLLHFWVFAEKKWRIDWQHRIYRKRYELNIDLKSRKRETG